MKNFLKIQILFVATLLLFLANTSLAKESKDSIKPKRFFIAKTAFGIFAKDIKPFKVDAAMNFASIATHGKFQYIPFEVLDSVFQKSMENNDTLTSLTLAKKLNADFFVFVRINKLANMMRIDMSAINAKDTNKKKYGVGYAAIRYRKLTDSKQLIDPPLLTAIMRAFALAVGDSTLFVINDTLAVRPVPTLIIGGINYINDETADKWEIFQTKEISSYDAIINIHDEIKDTPYFAVYDIDTRDSLYSLFNMEIVENYKATTTTELKTLYNMDVNYLITGILTRESDGAILDLYLCRILKDGKIKVLDKATGFISEDTIVEFKKVIRATTNKLMNKKAWLKK